MLQVDIERAALAAGAATLRSFCIGHVPPRFAPALDYTMLCPKPLGVAGELVIDDRRFGPGYDGETLAEYSHLFVTPWGTQDELGREITFGKTPHAPSYTRFRINHYVTQSLQFFRQFKQTSGAADAGAGHVRPDSWWVKHDRNDELDTSLERMVAPLRVEMQRIALPGAGVLHAAAASRDAV